MSVIPGVPDWVLQAVAGEAVRRYGPTGVTPDAVADFEPAGTGEPQYYYPMKRRRRRRRLLTVTDKADIAFIIGQLGQGQLARAAISSLLSRRV